MLAASIVVVTMLAGELLIGDAAQAQATGSEPPPARPAGGRGETSETAPPAAVRTPTAPPAAPGDEELLDRPIGRVTINGLSRVSEQEVRTNIRVAPGQPYDPVAIRDDVNTLYRLGQFKTVSAQGRVEADGTVSLTYVVLEQALISTVQTVGNKVVTDQELRAVIPLFANAPRDDFLVEQSIRDIKNLYRTRGHYLVDVQIDESRLQEEGILIFKIIEGPRVRVRALEFEGLNSFKPQELSSQLKTKPYFFLFRKGQLDEDVLLDDVATLNRFFRDRGFVDVRVDRRIDLSPDNREAKVVFVIAEGRQYRIRKIEAFSSSPLAPKPLTAFAPEQIIALLPIQRGDVYSQDLVRRSVRVIEDSYGLIGHVDVRVDEASVRVGEEPEIDLLFSIAEGRAATTGLVRIQGNFLTRDKIIRRETRLQPGRPLDGREVRETEERLRRTRLFGEPVRVVVQQPQAEDELEPNDDGTESRDVIIEVKERNTGSVNFGLAVGTDSGLFGEISIRQDNFDIADPPESFNELISGRAFRGAGQRFSIGIAPGIDISTFSINFAEPRLFETDVGFNTGSFYRIRAYDDYDEYRLNFNMGLGLRLGDVWQIGLTSRVERINLDDLASDAPVDVFEVAETSWLTGLGFRVVRNTLDKPLRPSRGTVLEVAFEQVGALGGDFTYPVIRSEYTQFFLIDEDFLGRKSTLRLNLQANYIFDDAPTYERFFLGGRSLRGFEFRTVSPKGIRNDTGTLGDDPVGGNWMFFAGTQYEFPIFGEFVNGVAFVDSGTVTDDVGFDEYRVGIGAGLRLYIPAFGPVPIALDFGYPIVDQDGDDEQLFSFSAELPF